MTWGYITTAEFNSGYLMPKRVYITIISILFLSSTFQICAFAELNNYYLNIEQVESDLNLNDLVRFTNNDWNGPKTGPAKRAGHDLSEIWGTDKILMFGGSDTFASKDYNDTWIYNVTTDSWKQLTPGTSPGKIHSYSLSYIHGTDKVILFGGRNPLANRLADTWIYDLSENNWKRMYPQNKPGSRESHRTVPIYGDDKVLLFGGDNKGTNFNDTWIYDFSENNWTRQYPANKPSARTGFGMTQIWRSYKILLYGGYSDKSLNDTWIYDYRENNWTLITPKGSPASITDDSIAYMWGTDHVLLFSMESDGFNEHYYTWIYDLSDNIWTKQNTTKNPEVYEGYAMGSGWGEFRVVFYGGFNISLPNWFSDKTYYWQYSASYSNDEFIFIGTDTKTSSEFNSISWTGLTTSNTEIKLQIRTATSEGKLTSSEFVGPDGKGTSYYTVSPSDTWSNHDGDRWIQVKAFFSTSSSSETPKFRNVIINFTESEQINIYYWNSTGFSSVTLGDLYLGTKTGVELSKKLINPIETDGELVLKSSYGWGSGSSGPSRRSGSVVTAIWGTDNILLFGGWGTDDQDWSKAVEYNDTWVYDHSTNSWTDKSPYNNPDIAVNGEMSPVCNTDKVVLWKSGTWIYDLSDNNWTKQTPNTSPSNLNQPEMVHVNATDKVLLIGTNSGKFETWEYDLSDNNWTKLSPGNSPASSADLLFSPIWGTDKSVLFNGDAWEYDYSENNWTKYSYWNDPGSWSSSMASVWGTDRIILFSQDDFGQENSIETWEFDLSDGAWIRRNPSSQPRYYAGPELTTIWGTNRVAMYGGFDQFSHPPFTKTLHKFSLTTTYNNGDYISINKDTEAAHYFVNLSWNGLKPINTSLKFQLRTADSEANLSTHNFVGPDGKTSTYYTVSPSRIWSGHDGDRWIQYKAYFVTTDQKSTPRLRNLTIIYSDTRVIDKNSINLLTPDHQELMNNSKPLFTWSVPDDPDFNQTAFQIIVDDNIDFSSIEYDSGLQNSTDHLWQFPNATGYSELTDGIWFWKVRIRNESGNLSTYSDFNEFVLDTRPPLPFSPLADPPTWTNKQIEITFSTTDNESGIGHYQINIDGQGFVTETCPYNPSSLGDGQHNVTIRAYDTAGNYIDAYIEIYFDSTAPSGLFLSASPGGWTKNTQPQITFSTTDNTSGLSHYTLKIDSSGFTNQTSPFILPPQAEGIHTITVRAYDNAGNFVDKVVKIYIDISSPSDFNPIANPPDWTYQDPEITFTTIDAISDIDYYEADIGSGFVYTTSPYIPILTEGIHEITIRAFDLAGNFIDGMVHVYIDRSGPSRFYFGINQNWSEDYSPAWVGTDSPDIYFHANDSRSEIEDYEIKIDNSNFSKEESPYTPSEPLTEGKHNVTIKAYDIVGNYEEETFQVYIDITPPEQFTPTVEPSIYSSDPRPTIEFSTTDSISDIAHYEVRIDNGKFTVQESKYTLPDLDDGVHKITVRAFDLAMNYVDSSINIYIDTKPPEILFISINEDDQFTNSSNVIVDIECSDSLTGCTEMVFSIDGTTWASWEPFKSSKEYTLSPDDGEKKVYVKVTDRAGNVAESVFGSIIYDATPPENAKITINGNSEFTKSVEIDLKLFAADPLSGLDRMSFSENGDTWTSFESFDNNKSLVLSDGDGEKTVYIRIADEAGNTAEAYDSIILDTTLPHSLSIRINNGSETTNSTEVILHFNAEDDTSGLAEMALSTDGMDWSPWEDFTSTKSYSLNSTEGAKTVYFKVNDRADNEADPVSATVTYIPPKRPELPDTNDTRPDDEKPDPDSQVPDNDTKPAVKDTSDKGRSNAGILIGISIIAVIIIIIIVFYSFNRKKSEHNIEPEKKMDLQDQQQKRLKEEEQDDSIDWDSDESNDNINVDWDD